MNQESVFKYIQDNGNDYELMKSIRLACDKNVKALNSSLKARAKPVVKYESSSLEVATEMKDSVLERYPFLTDKINLETWAQSIEQITSIDKHPRESVRPVMEWSQEHQFWQQQIRSGKNLRKHFEQMLVQMKSQARRMEFIS